MQRVLYPNHIFCPILRPLGIFVCNSSLNLQRSHMVASSCIGHEHHTTILKYYVAMVHGCVFYYIRWSNLCFNDAFLMTLELTSSDSPGDEQKPVFEIKMHLT